MYLYAIVFLLLVNFTSTHSACCEDEVRTQSLLDMAIDMISKAKSVVPPCEKNKQECPSVNLDCADLLKKGYNKSGIYSVTPVSRLTNQEIQVYCDMETEGGGWTVIQRRGNFGMPDDYFYKDWDSYRDGFGELEKDFWLGNDKIFALTNQKPYAIRFDMELKNKTRLHAKYESFWIDSEYNNYTLHIAGYSGNAGDNMDYHNKSPFTSKDKVSGWQDGESCADKYRGAWWYKNCYRANLNGLYNDESNVGIKWKEGGTLLTMVWTEMKIRPANSVSKRAASTLWKRYLANTFFPKNISSVARKTKKATSN